MSTQQAESTVHFTTSLSEATALLADLGPDGEPIAGGTWIMRTPTRAAQKRRSYVSLARIPDLHGHTVGESVDIGALLTHTELAAIDGGAAFDCVREAARQSAFPQVRNVATVGGNIAALGFAEADLVPALLAADAQLDLHTPAGATTTSVADYLSRRDTRPDAEVIIRVRIPTPHNRCSAFERLTVRAAGEYPIVNVAVSVDIDAGVVRSARIAVGSVESVARLCSAATELIGYTVNDPAAVERAADGVALELTARDGLDAPGWYRIAVLPVLIRRAIARLDNGSI